MKGIFAGHGVRFRYPEEWDLNEQQTEGDVSITVAGPETAFWSLALFFDRPGLDEVMESALAAFREEYEEIDIYPAATTVCDMKTLARDVEFVCLDLLNSAFLRVFQTDRFTALVLYQGTDRELEEGAQETLEAVSRTLQCG